MPSHNQQVRAGKDFGAAKMLDTGSLKRLHFHGHQEKPQCIFVNTTTSSGGGSSIFDGIAKNLPTLMMGGIAGATLYGAIKGSGGATPPSAAGGAQGPSRATNATIDAAANSGDANFIRNTIKQAQGESTGFEKQAADNNAIAKTATEASTAAGQKVTDLTKKSNDLTQDISKLNDAINQDTIDITNAEGKVNKAKAKGKDGLAELAAAEQELTNAQQKKIKHMEEKQAKEAEKTKNDQELAKQTEIRDTKKAEAEKAQAAANTATQNKQQMDQKIQQLNVKLEELEGKKNNTVKDTAIGGVIGAVGGAVVGGLMKGTKGAIVGGALGAVAGGGVGYYVGSSENSTATAPAVAAGSNSTPAASTITPHLAAAPQTPVSPTVKAGTTSEAHNKVALNDQTDPFEDYYGNRNYSAEIDSAVGTPEDAYVQFDTKIELAKGDKTQLASVKQDLKEYMDRHPNLPNQGKFDSLLATS